MDIIIHIKNNFTLTNSYQWHEVKEDERSAWAFAKKKRKKEIRFSIKDPNISGYQVPLLKVQNTDWFVVFYGILIRVNYLMPNPIYIYNLLKNSL